MCSFCVSYEKNAQNVGDWGPQPVSEPACGIHVSICEPIVRFLYVYAYAEHKERINCIQYFMGTKMCAFFVCVGTRYVSVFVTAATLTC